MVVINRAARAVLVLAVLWSAGCFLAALNWHGNWRFFSTADSQDDVVLHAQERWQHWVDMTLLGVVVAVAALVVALWPVVVAAGSRSTTEGERPGHAGFGGGSEESRRSAEQQRDAL